MVTLNELPTTKNASRGAALLGDQVKQDMADVLNEFGVQPAEQVTEAPKMTFGYGIPMAGVRYYTFEPA